MSFNTRQLIFCYKIISLFIKTADKLVKTSFKNVAVNRNGSRVCKQQINQVYVSLPDERDSSFDLDGLCLTIKKGDITEEVVDAIVNSTNALLDLSRG